MEDLRIKQRNINFSVPSLGWYGVVAVNSNFSTYSPTYCYLFDLKNTHFYQTLRVNKGYKY